MNKYAVLIVQPIFTVRRKMQTASIFLFRPLDDVSFITNDVQIY